MKWEQATSFSGPGILSEQVFDPATGRSSYEIYSADTNRIVNLPEYTDPQIGVGLRPVDNAFVRNGVVLFPSKSEPYGDTSALADALRVHIKRYVVLPGHVLDLVVAYILYTWQFERFRSAPYLRFQGDLGEGKSRALRVIGDLCYRPLVASSGASMAALFRSMDIHGGCTVVLDECDLEGRRDDHQDFMRMLRSGFQRGGGILRCEPSESGYEPKYFEVFGPKVMAGRGSLPDAALESRLIRVPMGGGSDVTGVPIELPDSYESEAGHLRNQLLRWKFEHFFAPLAAVERIDVEPRLLQLYEPLAAVPEATSSPTALRDYFVELQADLSEDRRQGPEGIVLAALVQRHKEQLAKKGEQKRVHVKVVVDLASPAAELTHKQVSSICKGFGLVRGRDSDGTFYLFAPGTSAALLRRYGVEQ